MLRLKIQPMPLNRKPKECGGLLHTKGAENYNKAESKQ